MAEFSPQELDELEDALENLEDVEDLAALGLADPLRERLEDYQNVLRVSRDALPLEDVSDDVLAGVLAEARAARTPTPDRPSLWKRWRAALIPAFALAGTTAAVLWIVKPDDPSTVELARTPTEDATETESPGTASPAATPEAAGAVAAEEVFADDDAEASADAEREPAKEEVADAKQSSKPGAPARKADGNDAYDAAPAPEPKPAEPVIDKEGAWDAIEAGHRARKRGDCDNAERLYRQAEQVAPNDKARAALWAGLALCAEQRGADGSKYERDAEAADPSIRAMIERERSASRSASNKGKPAPKKKSKARMPDEAAQQNAFPGE